MTLVPTARRRTRRRRLLATTLAAALLSAAPASAAIPPDLWEHDDAFVTLTGETYVPGSGGGAPEGAAAGGGVAGGCDIDGDGRDDAIVGAPSADVGGDREAGRVYVVPGSAARTAGTYPLQSAHAIAIEGVGAGQKLGAVVACAGDVNGDGSGDLVIGTANDSTQPSAYVVFGGTALASARTVAAGTHGFALTSATGAGNDVAAVGDLDGDGKAEVAVADRYATVGTVLDAGAVFVVAGKDDTAPVDLDQPSSSLLRIAGPQDVGELESVSRLGDLDGDGKPELAVGVQSWTDGSSEPVGAVFVVRGSARGVVELADWNAPGSPVLYPIWGPPLAAVSNSTFPTFGEALAPAGDVDDDGLPDLLVGSSARWTRLNDRPRRGSAWVVRGKAGGGAVDLASPGNAARLIAGAPFEDAADGFGTALAGIGDVDGDGRDDLAFGARDFEGSGTSTGAAYVVLGKAVATGDVDVTRLACGDGARIVGRTRLTGLGSGVATAPGITASSASQLLVGAGAARESNGNLAYAIPLVDMPGACGGEEPRAPPLDVDWGFRENFRRYVSDGFNPAAPAVPISASAGATCEVNPDTTRGGCDPLLRANRGDPLPQRALRWTPVGASATDGSDATIGTIGRVTFRYPGHFFTLNVEDPWFVVSGGQVTVRARVDLDVADGFAGARSVDVRVNLGTFPLDGAPVVRPQYVVWRTEPGTLTDEAAVSLGGFLGRGSQLDPVTIAIPRSLGPLPEEPRVPEPRTPEPRTPDQPRAPEQSRPPVKVEPPQTGPRAPATIAAGRRRATVRRPGRVTVATVRCAAAAAADCRVSVPARVRVRAGRGRVALRVTAPKRIARGKRATVRLTLTRSALRRLAGRSATARVPIAVRAGSRRTTKTVTVVVTVPRRR